MMSEIKLSKDCYSYFSNESVSVWVQVETMSENTGLITLKEHLVW